MLTCFDDAMHSEWLTATRYYQVSLFTDLLGDWVLVRRWGGRNTRRGGEKTDWVQNPGAGRKAYHRVCAARRRRGYWQAARADNSDTNNGGIHE